MRSILVCGVAALTLTALVGCSSGSSGARDAPDPTVSSAPAGSPAEAGVDAILNDVLDGLKTGSGIGADTSLATAATSLATASTKLAVASQQLTPAPQGVPDAAAAPVAGSLTRISGDLDDASRCLHAQAAMATPDARKCLLPLRAAQQDDAGVSRELITLAAYGSRTPAAFERLLVQALGGNQ